MYGVLVEEETVTLAQACNMRGACFPALPPSYLVLEKNHTQISLSYNADWSIRSGFLLANCHILINPFSDLC